MRTQLHLTHSPSDKRGFFIPYGYFVVFGLLVVIAALVVVVRLLHDAPQPAISGSAMIQGRTTSNAKPRPKINNFYDCYASSGDYRPGHPGVCVIHGQRYQQPSQFTTEDVRGNMSIPAGARGVVYTIANQNFHDCAVKSRYGPSLVATTDVLSVADQRFVYIGVSCDQGYREVIARMDGGGWQRISKTIGVIACKTVRRYQVPRTLFENSGPLGNQAAICQTPNGATIPISASGADGGSGSGQMPGSAAAERP